MGNIDSILQDKKERFVIKRTGEKVSFEAEKIRNAVIKAKRYLPRRKVRKLN